MSKSILRAAIHQIQQENDAIAYFPSYEIMMDDLRDYRFYESDMLHPNRDAITNIWNQFRESYIAESQWGLMKRIEKLQMAIDHRPRHENTEAFQKHKAFIESEKSALKDFF